MDFMHDQLFDGRKFRILTLVNNLSLKCLAFHVSQSLEGSDVIEVLERIRVNNHIVPERIQIDNGSEFISKDFYIWALENSVTLESSRPGKPTDNA
jgi:putative transposase